LAEHRLTDRLTFLLPPSRRSEIILSLGLLFILLLIAINSLFNTFWGPDWASLWPVVLFGLLLGWTLGIFGQSAFKTIILVLIIGFLYILLFPGGLSSQTWDVMVGSYHILTSLFASTKGWIVDFGPLLVSWQELLSAARMIIGQVLAWLAILLINPSAYDPLATSLFWDALIWLTSAWAGWVVIAKKNALLAATPVFMLTAGTLAYSRRVSLGLYLSLGLTIFLLAIVQHDYRKQIWVESGIAYPIRKSRQIRREALIVTIGLVILSAVISSISYQPVHDWVNRQLANNDLSSQSNQMAAAEGNSENISNIPSQQRNFLVSTSPGNSNRVVMTVSVGNMAALSLGGQLSQLYWRNATYDLYTGHGWTTSETKTRIYQAYQDIQPDRASGSILVEQNVFPAENLGKSVFASGEPITISLPSEATWRSPGDLFGLQITGSSNYQVFSLVPVSEGNSLRVSSRTYPDWVREKFLVLPQEIPARVMTLAKQLTDSEPTVFDKAMAIENYLRTYPYSLDVPIPPKQQDVVDYFLFDLKKGYCDYYSTAMVILSRASGIPARLAIGYAPGTYNLNSKRFIVTEADAHSWAEIYFPGVGWIPFEATPVLPAQYWSQPVITQTFPPNRLPSHTSGQSLRQAFPWSLLPAACFGMMSLLIITWYGLDRFRLSRLSESATAAEVYSRIRRHALRLGSHPEPGVTPYEFSEILSVTINELMQKGIPASIGSKMIEDVRILINGIVNSSYRAIPTPDEKMADKWLNLRWRFWLAWLIRSSRWIWASQGYEF
jgi:hypothetical protein